MTDESASGTPSDEMRQRVPGSKTKLRVLLSVNRWLLSAVVLFALFVVFVVLGVLDPAPLRASAGKKDPIETLFQGFLTAIITGVTLVVTIGQLVLSQELGAVGDQRDRMEGAMAFRKDVEEVLEDPVAPVEPAAFLRALVETVDDRAAVLGDTVSGQSNDEVKEQVSSFAADLSENAGDVGGRLADSQFGTFAVVFAALDFNYSWKINEARRLANVHADVLDETTREALDEVVEVLELFGPAREHVKTLYFQWELIDLSRAVIYASLPALVVTISMIIYVDNPSSITGATLGVDNLVLVTSAASTVALMPFVLLLSYILRIATVTKRTLAIGPFVLRDADYDDRGDRE